MSNIPSGEQEKHLAVDYMSTVITAGRVVLQREKFFTRCSCEVRGLGLGVVERPSMTTTRATICSRGNRGCVANLCVRDLDRFELMGVEDISQKSLNQAVTMGKLTTDQGYPDLERQYGDVIVAENGHYRQHYELQFDHESPIQL